MISIPEPGARAVHPLARFVTKEAIALLLNLKPHEIYRIDCWRYVIHVVGKGIAYIRKLCRSSTDFGGRVT
jgi:hypothetical protein